LNKLLILNIKLWHATVPAPRNHPRLKTVGGCHSSNLATTQISLATAQQHSCNRTEHPSSRTATLKKTP